MNEALQIYYALIEKGDRLYDRAKAYFGSCITCRDGCSDCCVDIGVFPVEWYAIELWLQEQGLVFGKSVGTQRCVFLDDGSCGIYAMRPLICRVSGVPLMYLMEPDDYIGREIPAAPEYQVTWCEYNLKDLSGSNGQKVINDETVIDQEALNTELAEINYRFLKSPEGRGYVLGHRYTIGGMHKRRSKLWKNIHLPT